MKRWKHEESIQNKLRGYTPPIDSDALWDSVKHEVPRKRNRFVVVLLWIGVGAAIGLFGDRLINSTDAPLTETASDIMNSPEGDGNIAILNSAEDLDEVAERSSVDANAVADRPFNSNSKDNRLQSRSRSNNLQIDSGGFESNSKNYSLLANSSRSDSAYGSYIEGFDKSVNRELVASLATLATYMPYALEAPDTTNIDLPVPDTKIISAPKAPVGLIIYAGAGTANGSFKPASNSDYLESVLNAISGLPTIEAGVAVAIPVGSRWRIQPGVLYTRYSTRLNWTYNLENRLTQPGIQKIIVDENGGVETVTGVIGATQVTKTTGQFHTYVHKLGVELNIGYMAWSARKFRLYLLGGGSVNTTVASAGTMPNTNGLLTKWGSETNPYKGVSLGLGAGASIEYYVSRNIAFTLTPNINFTTLTFDNNEFAFEQGITTIGCRLGALIQL